MSITFRSNGSQMLYQIRVPKHLAKFTEKTPVLGPFLKIVSRLHRPATLLKKILW